MEKQYEVDKLYVKQEERFFEFDSYIQEEEGLCFSFYDANCNYNEQEVFYFYLHNQDDLKKYSFYVVDKITNKMTQVKYLPGVALFLAKACISYSDDIMTELTNRIEKELSKIDILEEILFPNEALKEKLPDVKIN